MKLLLKGQYTILGEIQFEENEDEINFTVPFDHVNSVEVKLFPKENTIEAFQELDVEEKFLELLEEDKQKNVYYYNEDLSVFDEKSSYLSDAVKKTIYAIRFFFNWGGLDKDLFSKKGIYWSTDEANWFHYPIGLRAHSKIVTFHKLSKDNSNYIQAYLDGQLWEPFLAFQFLDKAKTESRQEFKWINATIAAELAIKEFYIRYDNKFERFILEVPSPPLHKLYGSILESIVGEKSPVVKSIAKGVEIRNKLVHRPNTEDIDISEANQYVEEIELGMFHLLSLLYSKEDPIIKEKLEPTIRIKNL